MLLYLKNIGGFMANNLNVSRGPLEFLNYPKIDEKWMSHEERTREIDSVIGKCAKVVKKIEYLRRILSKIKTSNEADSILVKSAQLMVKRDLSSFAEYGKYISSYEKSMNDAKEKNFVFKEHFENVAISSVTTFPYKKVCNIFNDILIENIVHNYSAINDQMLKCLRAEFSNNAQKRKNTFSDEEPPSKKRSVQKVPKSLSLQQNTPILGIPLNGSISTNQNYLTPQYNALPLNILPQARQEAEKKTFLNLSDSNLASNPTKVWIYKTNSKFYNFYTSDPNLQIPTHVKWGGKILPVNLKGINIPFENMCLINCGTVQNPVLVPFKGNFN